MLLNSKSTTFIDYKNNLREYFKFIIYFKQLFYNVLHNFDVPNFITTHIDEVKGETKY